MARKNYRILDEHERYMELCKDVPEMIETLCTGEIVHCFERHLNQKGADLRALCIGDQTDKGSFYGNQYVLITELKKIMLNHSDVIADMLTYGKKFVTITVPMPSGFPLNTKVYRYGKGHEWKRGPLIANTIRIVIRRDRIVDFSFEVTTAFPLIIGHTPYVYYYERKRKNSTW